MLTEQDAVKKMQASALQHGKNAYASMAGQYLSESAGCDSIAEISRQQSTLEDRLTSRMRSLHMQIEALNAVREKASRTGFGSLTENEIAVIFGK